MLKYDDEKNRELIIWYVMNFLTIWYKCWEQVRVSFCCNYWRWRGEEQFLKVLMIMWEQVLQCIVYLIFNESHVEIMYLKVLVTLYLMRAMLRLCTWMYWRFLWEQQVLKCIVYTAQGGGTDIAFFSLIRRGGVLEWVYCGRLASRYIWWLATRSIH